MTRLLLTPADLDAHPWAACGPASLAAVTYVPLGDLKACFPRHTPERVWTNLTQMRDALGQLGFPWCDTPEDASGRGRAWPRRGLALVQFEGPWEAPNVPVVAALEHTHWVAASTPTSERGADLEPMVFDVNALDVNYGWTPKGWWSERVLPGLIRYRRRATGGWHVRAGLDLVPGPRRHVLRVEPGEPSLTGECEVCGATNVSYGEPCPGPLRPPARGPR